MEVQMKNLLYITASPKNDEISTSKKAGNIMINELKNNYNIIKLDLYKESIPTPTNKLFKSSANCFMLGILISL